VNDDPVQLKVLGALLVKEGWDVRLHASVEAALRAMASPGSIHPPDLIVTDLNMPEIDGWHFCRLLRSAQFKAFNKVPILVTSATYSGVDIANISSGIGAEAFIALPVETGPFLALVKTLLAGERFIGVPRVLIVEDDAPLLRLLGTVFRANGYEFAGVATKRAALAAIAEQTFDLAVLDFHLPDGKGDEILAAIRRDQPGCACLMVTSDTTPSLALKWVKDGASAYVLKPFEPSYLLEMCASARREQSRRRTEALLDLRTRELQEREALFRTVADNTRDWELWVGPKDEILYTSPSCERITGYSREAFLSDADLYRRIIHPGDRHLLCRQPVHSAGEEDDGALVLRLTHKDGNIRFIEQVCHPVLRGDGTFQGFRVSNRDITRRRGMEEALRESDARFRLIAENTSDGILSLDGRGVVTYASPAYLSLLGHDAADAFGKGPGDLIGRIHPDDREGVLSRIRNAIGAGMQSLIYSFRARHKDGHYLWLEDHARFTYHPDGTFAGCNVICRDTTEQKRADETLRMVFVSMEQSPVSILITDRDGAIQYVNPAFSRVTGYESSEVLGLNARILKSGHHSREFYHGIWQTLESGRTWSGEMHNRKKNGDKFIEWATISPVRDDRGSVIGYVAVKEDVTERQRSEDALRKSEAHKRALVHAIPDLIFINHRDGEFLDYYASKPEELCVPPGTFLHRMPWEVLPETLASRFMEAFKEAHEGNCMVELPYALPMGEALRHFEARIVPLVDECVLTIVRDITSKVLADEANRELQHRLQHSQKMESLGRLAGGVAHDMNNVLMAVMGLAEIHMEAQSPDSPTRRALETIIKAAQRGGELVKALLRFAHQAKAEDKVVDLNELIHEQARLLARTTLAKVRILLDIDENLMAIRGDANALSHALINLCVNAADAMPEGGTLTLRTRNLGPDWVEARVEDTGEGMPQEVLDRVLEPFFTTKAIGKGTGLGLSLVYSTVNAHHGKLEIKSEVGLGTCVALQFPAGMTDPGPGTVPAGIPHEAGSLPLDVFVVDDDDLVKSALSEQLAVLGCVVKTFGCGEEVLASLEAGVAPDVILLDMHMPGLGGRGTFSAIRSQWPNLPVVIATGRTEPSTLDLVQGDPHVTLLSKPFSLEALRAALLVLRAE